MERDHMENSNPTPPIALIAVVQAEDADGAMIELEKIGIFSANLPSVGGFLGRRNATLFIAAPQHRVQDVIDTLQHTCKQRLEYIATHIESASVPMPMPIPVTVGGAAIFSISMDYFEEF